MRKIICAAIIALIPLAANAAEEELALKYEAHWSGFKAGEVKLYLGEHDKDYKFTANVESYGILRRLTNYWSRNFVTGKVSSGQYKPENYNSTWQRKKKTEQQVVVDYLNKGKKVESTANPPMKQGKRPLIEDKDKIGTLDPISAGVAARRIVKEAMESAKPLPYDFSLPVFDGTRVFKLNFSVKGYQTKNISGKTQRLLHVFLSRDPVAGFSPKELDIERKDAPVFDVYVNEHYIPVWAVGTAPLGTATITLADMCNKIDGCNL